MNLGTLGAGRKVAAEVLRVCGGGRVVCSAVLVQWAAGVECGGPRPTDPGPELCERQGGMGGTAVLVSGTGVGGLTWQRLGQRPRRDCAGAVGAVLEPQLQAAVVNPAQSAQQTQAALLPGGGQGRRRGRGQGLGRGAQAPIPPAPPHLFGYLLYFVPLCPCSTQAPPRQHATQVSTPSSGKSPCSTGLSGWGVI